jgi:hypothetical protein
LVQEIFHHTKQAEVLRNKMNHMKTHYSNIENYILNDSNRPFVITGRSGEGKSSLMAYASKKVCFFIL